MGKENTEKRLVRVYGEEIVEYETTICREFLRLRDACNAGRPNASVVHRHVRIILNEAAHISLILFPNSKSNPDAVSRAKLLCKEFRVSDDSIIKFRTMRNHLAHIDERLDRWAASSERQTFGRWMLGSRDDALRIGLNTEDILGLFDTNTMTYSFLTDDIDVDELVFQIQCISRNVRRKLSATPRE